MTTTLRRILTAVAAAGVLSLAGAGPAAAEHERGSGPYSVSREGFVDDADLVPLRTGLGATLVGLALTGAAVAGLHRHASGGAGPSRERGDLDPAPRAGLA